MEYDKYLISYLHKKVLLASIGGMGIDLINSEEIVLLLQFLVWYFNHSEKKVFEMHAKLLKWNND